MHMHCCLPAQPFPLFSLTAYQVPIVGPDYHNTLRRLPVCHRMEGGLLPRCVHSLQQLATSARSRATSCFSSSSLRD
jgi:hypothetical protein